MKSLTLESNMDTATKVPLGEIDTDLIPSPRATELPPWEIGIGIDILCRTKQSPVIAEKTQNLASKGES